MACTQARNWRTWFLMPWLLVPLLFFFIDTLPFLATVVVLAAIFVFIRRLISYMWLGKDTNNPFFMSVMAAAYALSTWVYFIKIFPGSVTTTAAPATTTLHVSSTFVGHICHRLTPHDHLTTVTNEYGMLTMFFIGVNFMWASLFLYLVRSDPGFLKLDEAGVEKIYHKLSLGAKNIPQLCPTCMVRCRPLSPPRHAVQFNSIHSSLDVLSVFCHHGTDRASDSFQALQELQPVCRAHGPPLRVAQQLRGREQPPALHGPAHARHPAPLDLCLLLRPT